VEPSIPPAKPGGNKRTVDIRQVVNGVMYVLSTGCQWRAIPKDLPPRSMVHDYLERWTWDGTLERLHHALYVKCREQASREASPTAAVPRADTGGSGAPTTIRRPGPACPAPADDGAAVERGATRRQVQTVDEPGTRSSEILNAPLCFSNCLDLAEVAGERQFKCNRVVDRQSHRLCSSF
jgi:transposase